MLRAVHGNKMCGHCSHHIAIALSATLSVVTCNSLSEERSSCQTVDHAY